VTRSRTIVMASAAALAAGVAVAIGTIAADPTPRAPFVVFRTLAPRDAHGYVAWLPLASPDARRRITGLVCARVQFTASAGVCLTEEARGREVAHIAYVLDRRFVPRHRFVLSGIPVRCRLSPDGRWAAITVYAEEESPAGERLATESVLIDVPTGRRVADLREFALDHAGFAGISDPIDISSVTFDRDSDRFFATLTSSGRRYLVAGSVGSRTLRIVRAGIVNEALSADGRRLIGKQLHDQRGFWQLTVIDLDTWEERALNQGPRSVDDQVDWLDDAHVLYHDVTEDGTAIWKLPADGSGGPQPFIRDAFSASVVR
jgi:hypothetical protein